MSFVPRGNDGSRASMRFPLIVDRYAIYGEIAAGGMASVHFARLRGAQGFSRTVAAKRLLPRLGRDREFALMLIDEARLAARIHHPNVVSTLDVVQTHDELVLVMDYVHGESVATLMRNALARNESVPLAIALAILIDTLHGLHAAHEAKDEHGVALGIVHRDISPQNLLVATDGVTRIVDFGVAKAAGRLQATADGVVKGKVAYMAPEQIDLGEATRQSDLFACSVVLWELLTGARLFAGTNTAQIMHQVLSARIPKASSVAPAIPLELDAILARGLAADPADRYASALDMARALEACAPPIRPAEIGAWVSDVAAEALEQRALLRAAVEQHDPEQSDSETAAHEMAVVREHASGSPFSSQPRSGSARTSNDSPVTRTLTEPPPPDPGGATDASAVLASSARPVQRRNRIGLLAFAALVIALVGAWLYVGSQTSRAVRSAQASDAMPPEEPSSASSSSAAPIAATSAATIGNRAPEVSSANPATAAPRKFEATKGHAVSTAPAPVRPHAGECDPPYSIDAAGHHLFKVQCM